MSLFAEFTIPADIVALYHTLQAVPDAVIEVERVVAADDILTPYFWVDHGSKRLSDFERAAHADPSVRHLRRLDEFENAALYRAEWTTDTGILVYVATHLEVAILGATGQRNRWEFRVRFDDRKELDAFQGYCRGNDIKFELRRLYELSHPRAGGRYGLTPKQRDALETAWEMGYFETSREATMEAVAETLGITQQSLSERLRRGQKALVANTLRIATATERLPGLS